MAYRTIDCVSPRINREKWETASNIKSSGGSIYRGSITRRKQYRKLTSIYLIALLLLQTVIGVFLFVPTEQARADVPDSWYDSSWLYRKKIIIDHTKVPNTDQSNFPVLVSLTDNFLKTAPVGKVHDSHGYDIVFTDQSGSVKLDHEIESYDGINGTITMWVKVPTLSHAAPDTAIYMYYGNPNISSTQENRSGVWNSNYQSVLHLGETMGLSNVQAQDSTSYGHSGTSLPTINNNIHTVSQDINKYEAFPDITKLPDGNWLVVYKKGTSHVYDDATAQIVYRTSSNGGVTWSSETVLSDTPSTNMNWQNAWTTTIGNRIFMFLMEYDSETNMKTWLRYSDDNGSTWSAKTQITSSYLNTSFYQHGQVVQDPSGNLLIAGWGRKDSETKNQLAIIKSADNGITWTDLSHLDVNSKTDNGNTSEPSLVFASNGDLLLKEAHGKYLYRSIDNGVSWDDGSNINYRLESPMFIIDDADIVLCGRTNPYDYTTSCTRSSDNGITWSVDTVIDTYGGSVNDGGYVGLIKNGSSIVAVYYTNDGGNPYIKINSDIDNPNFIYTGAQSIVGKIGDALNFDGSSNVIDFGDINSVEGIGAITVSAWIYPTANNTRGMILAKDNLNQRSWYLSKSDDGTNNYLKFSIGDSTSGMVTSTTAVTINSWNHVIATYDKNGALSTDRLRIYINGNLSSGNPVTDRTADLPATTSLLQLGARQYAGTRQYFTGSIDEVRISDIACSADWIKTEYNNQSSPDTFFTFGEEENSLPAQLTEVGLALVSSFSVSYTFNSTKSGTIVYSGKCSSPITAATQGSNTVTFDNLSEGQYSDCAVKVINAQGLDSNILSIPAFTISHSASFVPPAKPSITNISITNTNTSTPTLTNLPNTITQIAVSATKDFTNVSWEDISKKEELLKQYINQQKEIYIKFRTNDGAVSDVIIYNPQTANNTQDSDTTTENTNIPLNDGDIVKTPSSPDIYVIKLANNKKYKRLILSPQVFNSYHHLKWDNIKTITEEQLNQYQTSTLVKELNDTIVYTLTPHGDQGQRKPFDLTQTYDPDSIYTINKVDRDSYEWEK